MWLINETERPISEVDWDPDDSDEEYEAAEQRLIEERISRPDREEPLILVAEQSWNEKIAEQNANATSIGNCLVTLFKNMHMLCSIEIGQWTFNSYDGIEVSRYSLMFYYIGEETNLALVGRLIMRSNGTLRKQSISSRHLHERYHL